MREIRAEIEINAPRERIWAVLVDAASYSQWNPFIRSVRGDFKVGGTLHVVARFQSGFVLPFRPKLLIVEPPTELRWLGSLPLPGLFEGEHAFRIEQLAEGRSRFVQTERFAGLLTPFMGWLAPQNRKGYMRMNTALKERVERC